MRNSRAVYVLCCLIFIENGENNIRTWISFEFLWFSIDLQRHRERITPYEPTVNVSLYQESNSDMPRIQISIPYEDSKVSELRVHSFSLNNLGLYCLTICTIECRIKTGQCSFWSKWMDNGYYLELHCLHMEYVISFQWHI